MVKINGVKLVPQPVDNLGSRKSGGKGRSYDVGYKTGRWDGIYDWTMPENSWYHLGYKDGIADRAAAMLAGLQ